MLIRLFQPTIDLFLRKGKITFLSEILWTGYLWMNTYLI